jgi:hypothetical protein
MTTTLIGAWGVHRLRQAETARRLAVDTWLQANGVITTTQGKKVLPVFLEQIAHNLGCPTTIDQCESGN